MKSIGDSKKNTIKKVALSFTFLFLTAAFVFASGWPYNPGDTLDPGCNPGDLDCVVTASGGGMVIGDSVANSDKGSIFFSDGNNSLGQDSSNFFWDATSKLLGVGTSSPGARIHSDGSLSTASDISSTTKTVDISAYNKLSLNGTYSGSISSTWIIQIVDDSVDPQLFRYSTDNGSTWSSGLPITAGYNLLEDGVEAGFSTTTGYANGDEWQFDVTAGSGSDIDALFLSVNGFEEMRVGKDGIRFYDSYTFPGQDGSAGQVLSTDGSGGLSWVTASGGGGSSSLTKNAVGFGNGYDALSGDVNNLFWDFDSNRMAIGSSSASAALDIFSSSYNQTTDTSGWQAQVNCTNCVTTLDDFNINTSSAFSGVANADYEITIDGTSPDTFSWSKDGIVQATGVSILGTNQNQLLDDGVEINFDGDSGHTLNTTWLVHEYVAKPSKPSYVCTNCVNSLNDLVADASGYTNGVDTTYTVTIDGTSPDTFSWSRDSGPIASSGISIQSGVPYSFPDLSGATITFNNDSGHILGSSWDIDISYQNSSSNSTHYNDPLQVRQDNGSVVFKVLKDGHISFSGVDYAFPTGQGSSGQVLKNDGNGNLTWQDDNGGGGGSSLIGSTSSTFNETWLGDEAGAGATANYTTFIGSLAGKDASNAGGSTFIGESAGKDATNSANSIFLGSMAGSVFGGNGSSNAANSIFIGYQSGYGPFDNYLDNTGGSTSILLGNNTSTGGYEDSIAIGKSAINTASNQFLVDDSYTQFNMRGVNWVMPSSQGGAGEVLTNDGSGNLSWTTVSGGGGSSLDGFTTTSNTVLGVAAGANLSGQIGDENTYIGWGAGYANHDGFYNTAIGSKAGYGNNNGENNIFLGRNAGYFGMNINNSGSRNTLLGVYSGTTTSSASDAVALGYGAVAASNQFALSDDITSWKFQGDSYTLPTSDGTSGQALTTNGSGVLTWATPSGGSSLLGSTSTSGTETWLGSGAGINGSTDRTVYIGLSAGNNATDAYYSNFFGNNAGYGAANSNYSNFMGVNAGYDAINAYNSNFIGSYSGSNATYANGSNFFGNGAGSGATSAYSSNFFGSSAGSGATNANASNFFGTQAGYAATNADRSNFIGNGTGSGATHAYDSNFIGVDAGYNAINAHSSNFMGVGAGDGAASASYSNFFGMYAGNNADNADQSTFIGTNSGDTATNANQSIFLGSTSGYHATNASYSGFIGSGAGVNATNASRSSFFGSDAGANATNAASSVFIGSDAGREATNAKNSIFIGRYAGYQDKVNNSSSGKSILIGYAASTGDDGFGAGYSDSIALGTSATNTAANQFMIGSAASPITSTRINGSGSTQCTITTGTGIACTSDERMKENITDIEDVLSSLQDVRTVTYNWKDVPDSPLQIGFIAQNLEQVFPQLVATDSEGYKSVYYSQMTPILTKAVQDIFNLVDSFKEKLIAWFADAANGIGDLFVKRVRTETLCVGTPGNETCITKEQLDNLLGVQNVTTGGNSGGGGSSVGGGGGAVTPDPDPIPDSTPILDSNPVVDGNPDPAPDPDPEPAPDPTPTPDPAPESTPE